MMRYDAGDPKRSIGAKKAERPGRSLRFDLSNWLRSLGLYLDNYGMHLPVVGCYRGTIAPRREPGRRQVIDEPAVSPGISEDIP